MQGKLDVEMEAECDRCLGRARFPLHTSLDLFYRPMSFIARDEDLEIDEGAAQLGFYENGGMKLEDILHEQISQLCKRAAGDLKRRVARAFVDQHIEPPEFWGRRDHLTIGASSGPNIVTVSGYHQGKKNAVARRSAIAVRTKGLYS